MLISIINVNSGKSLDVLNASSLNGTPIQQYTYLGGSNQIWEAIPVDSTYYEIRNFVTGKVLDAVADGTANGTRIQQWNYLGGDNQKWQFILQDDGTFEIANKLSGRGLDVIGNSVADQARIQLWDYYGNANQRWQVTTVTLPGQTTSSGSGSSSGGGSTSITADTTYYVIGSLATGKVFDVVGGSTADQAQIQQYDYLYTSNQQWSVVPVSGDCVDSSSGSFGSVSNFSATVPSCYYKIVNRASGKVLDAPSNLLIPGAPIQQYTYVGNDNQLWEFIPTSNGYYEIANKASGLALDVMGLSTQNGALIQSYTYLGGTNQQFALVPITAPGN
jgi:hypothetical protein